MFGAVLQQVWVPTGLCRTGTGREASNRGSNIIYNSRGGDSNSNSNSRSSSSLAVLGRILLDVFLNWIFTARKSFSELFWQKVEKKVVVLGGGGVVVVVAAAAAVAVPVPVPVLVPEPEAVAVAVI